MKSRCNWLSLFFSLCLVFLLGNTVKGQDSLNGGLDTASLSVFYDMSLEQLDSVKASGISSELEKFINSLISTSTTESLKTRNDPSVVTLITAEEIRNSGARDLIDVLRLVPGYHFALDRSGSVGIGIRGNWANEGKVLLLIDGQEMNEVYTATLSFGNHYPVDMIERIEVIRGPGSAIYGGFAEFGVINIITKNQTTYDGVYLSGTRGQMMENRGRTNFSGYVGRRWRKMSLSFSLFAGQGQRSNDSHFGFYRDADRNGIGAFSPLTNNARLDPAMTNLRFTWGGFTYNAINDLYRITDVDSIDSRGFRRKKRTTNSSFNQFKYEWKVNDKLTITPLYSAINSSPERENPNEQESSTFINRNRFKTLVNYQFDHRTSFVGGIDVYSDFASADTLSRFFVGREDVVYWNQAILGQAYHRFPWGNFVVGLRLERNSNFGSNFVPRVGFTKTKGRWHFKAMVSDAFRAPAIGNVAQSFDGTYSINEDSTGVTNVGRDITSEETLFIEAEVGYKPTPKMILTANIFFINTRNPIVFSSYQDDTLEAVFGPAATVDFYRNTEQSGSSGIELDYRFHDKWGYINVNYSFYNVDRRDVIPEYSVREFNFDVTEGRLLKDNVLLAFPAHKVNLTFNWYVRKNLSLNLTGSYIGTRYGYDIFQGGDVFDEDGNLEVEAKFNVSGQLKEFRPTYLANAFLRYQNAFTEGLEFGFGVYDILGEHYQFIQPYFGLNPPLPGPTREFVLRASYNIPFKPYKIKTKKAKKKS